MPCPSCSVLHHITPLPHSVICPALIHFYISPSGEWCHDDDGDDDGDDGDDKGIVGMLMEKAQMLKILIAQELNNIEN